MLRLFQICFFTGVLYTLVSFLLGQLFDFMDIDGDIDMDGGLFGLTVSPLKPIVITAFVTVFGGIGIICINNKADALIALLIALISAFFIAFIIYRFIVVPLYKAQNTSAVSQSELIGKTARVKLAIKKNSFGRITYTVNGNTYSSPAKAIDEKNIEKDEDVVIIEIKNKVFYVDKL